MLRPTTRMRLLLPAALLAAGLLATSALAGSVSVEASGPGLATRVAEALRGVDLAPAASIKVTASKGVIILSGTTATVAARDRAARASEGVAGVNFQEIRIGIRPTRKAGDETLTTAVQDAVRGVADYQAPDAVNLTAIVQGGVATLSGSVQWAEDKYRAETAAGSVDGVIRVTNDIHVDPRMGSRPITIVVVPELPTDIKSVELSPDGRTLTINGNSYAVVAKKVGVPSGANLPPGYLVSDRLILVTPAQP